MTTLNHHEFDDTDNTSAALRAEEHEYAEAHTVNDSGFFGDEEEPLAVEETLPEAEPSEYPGYHEIPEDTPVASETHDEDVAHQPVPEALGEHHPGESVGEWLRNDWERTKQDLHIGKKEE